MRAKKVTLRTVLKKVFGDLGLTYIIKDATIEVMTPERAKNFTVTERVKTEFRGEFFNVFNFANFDIPGHTLGNSDFGIINSAKPARIVELALRVIF